MGLSVAKFSGSARVSPTTGSILALSADGLIMAEPALPHESRPRPREQEPASLHRHRLHELRPLQPAEKDRYRTKQLIVKRQPFHHGLDCGWHDVDRKHLAAEEIFERINDENDGGNFQNPKRPHHQAVSDEELNEPRHHNRGGRQQVDERIGRQHDVLPEINEDQRDRRQSDEAVNETATQKYAGP